VLFKWIVPALPDPDRRGMILAPRLNTMDRGGISALARAKCGFLGQLPRPELLASF